MFYLPAAVLSTKTVRRSQSQ